jgi:hypothetical protein
LAVDRIGLTKKPAAGASSVNPDALIAMDPETADGYPALLPIEIA